MAQVILCDSCGNLTTQVAAKMFIYFAPSFRDMHARTADVERDLCEPCVRKLMEEKPVALKVLTAEEASQL